MLVGGAGLVSCLTFVWFSAPDLATTQMLVEIVTTVLLLLGLRWLPKRLPNLASPSEEARARRRRLTDLAIASAAGLGVAAIAFAVMTRPSASPLAKYFLEHAYSEGGGRNVVNVLLVDFRAFDTLGEITVLGIVGLTIWALLRRFRPASDSLGHTEQKRIQDDSDDRREDRKLGDTLSETMLIPRVVMRWLFPFIVLLALHLFLRGHDLPGGGCLALTNATPTKPSEAAGGTVAFEVDDLDALVADLKDKGVAFRGDIIVTPVCRMAICVDSEGNSLVLHQLKPE